MNAPAAPRGLDYAAIGVGAAIGIGASIAMSLLWVLMPSELVVAHVGIVVAVSHLLGAAIDIATGAAAGWLARRRGSMHGLFAGLIANIVSLAIGYATTLLRTGYGDTVEEVMSYLVSIVPWQIAGVALATIAGAIAVRFANRAGRAAA
jgi:hypothetical protein